MSDLQRLASGIPARAVKEQQSASMRFRFALAAVMLGAMPVASLAAAPRSVDARALDVAGVKTGMDFDQAVQAASANFHVAKTMMKPEPSPSVNVVTHTRLPSYFTYESGGVRLLVHFEPRVPLDKAHILVVSQVSYEVPWSQQNKASMAAAAKAKYGISSNAPNDLPYEWCAMPSDNPGIGCNAKPQAVLKLSQVQMTLIDPAWQNARIRYLEDKQAVKPSF